MKIAPQKKGSYQQYYPRVSDKKAGKIQPGLLIWEEKGKRPEGETWTNTMSGAGKKP